MNHLVEEELFFRRIRQEFPQIDDTSIYFDSAATTLKPKCVIDALVKFYSKEYATVHRSVYGKAKEASERFYKVRTHIKQLFNASSEEEIIFTKNTTDSLNMLARMLCQHHIKKGTKVLISQMEHHSNIVPWQMACEQSGAKLVTIPLQEDLSLNLETLEKELSHGKTSVLSLCHISNILSTINPIEKIAPLVKKAGAIFVVDGAQSAPCIPIDLQAMGSDFFACSAHKMYGPTGVGILWGKKEILEQLSPVSGGGGMVDRVTFEKTTFDVLPTRFEAGTPSIAEVIAFGESISFLQRIGIEKIAHYEKHLIDHLRQELALIPSVQLLGESEKRGPLQSMTFEHAHPLDVATLLDMKGIAVRTGHLCCQPLLSSLNLSSVLRLSLGVYNTISECDRFIQELKRVLGTLR